MLGYVLSSLKYDRLIPFAGTIDLRIFLENSTNLATGLWVIFCLVSPEK